MAQRCFMVYPLPFVADDSFLNVIFDGSVRRSVLAGFGAGRFALVELQDDTHAEAVKCAIKSAPSSPHTNMLNNSTALGDGVDQNDERTFEELFEAHSTTDVAAIKAAKKRKAPTVENNNKGKSNKDADGVAKLSGIAHIGRLRFRGNLLQVVPSPIALDEIFSCGGQLPGYCSRKKTEIDKLQGWTNENRFLQKRQRTESAEDVARSSQQLAAVPVKGKKEEGTVTFLGGMDACRRCGSTEHFTRQCSATPHSVVAVEKSCSGNETHKRKGECVFPAGSCQKCGSLAHFTRHCDVNTSHLTESCL